MAGIDNALGISPQVLALRAQRMNLLSANIANADTPNYKAQDIDFKAALETARSERSTGGSLDRSNSAHLSGFDSPAGEFVKYRGTTNTKLNGNTVESHKEHSAFMDNAMRYQASLNLLDSRIKGLMSAIKGGQ